MIPEVLFPVAAKGIRRLGKGRCRRPPFAATFSHALCHSGHDVVILGLVQGISASRHSGLDPESLTTDN